MNSRVKYAMVPLEEAVLDILDRLDALEAAVVALCQQDGEVTYEPKD